MKINNPMPLAGPLSHNFCNLSSTVAPDQTSAPCLARLLVFTAMIAATLFPCIATAAEDTYPWKNAKQGSLDNYGYVVDNCTSEVAWLLHSVNGFEMPRAFGDAGNWGPNAIRGGIYRVDRDPAPGAVAYYLPKGSMNLGHVCWVESVSPDKSTIHIREYNWPSVFNGNKSLCYGERTIRTSEVSGFIHFKDLDARSDSLPGIGYHLNGSMTVALRGTQGAYSGRTYVMTQTGPNAGFGPVVDLGGGVIGRPVLGRGQDNLLMLFTRGGDNHTYARKSYFQNNGLFWGGWADLGGTLGCDLVVSNDQDHRLMLGAVDPNGNIGINYQTYGGAWAGWSGFSGIARPKVGLGTNIDGTELYSALGTNGEVYLRSQHVINSWWDSWISLGGNLLGKPVLKRDGYGRNYLVIAGGGGVLYYRRQSAPNSNAWEWWLPVAGSSSIWGDPAVETDSNGQIWVFAHGSQDNSIYFTHTTSTDTWTPWQSMNCNVASQPVVAKNADGRLQIFELGFDHRLYSAWQMPGGGWSGWQLIGDGVARY